MGLALLAFVVMTSTILGGYFGVTMLPGSLERRRLDRRLREVSLPVTPAPEESAGTVIQRPARGPSPLLDRMLDGSYLKRLIEQSSLRTTPSAIVFMSVGLAGVMWLVASLFIQHPLARPPVAAVGLVAPTLWLKRCRHTRLKRFEEQFPEALDLLSRAIRAGHAFQTAMGMVADELPPPVGPEFKKTFDQQNFGLPLRDALNELMDRIGLLDVRFFVTAVLIQRDTGGNLAEILDNLASVVRERFRILRQVRVHSAHGRFTGYVLLALPAFLGVTLMYLNPGMMKLLFTERMGYMMIMGAMALQTIGFFWIRKIIRIEV